MIRSIKARVLTHKLSNFLFLIVALISVRALVADSVTLSNGDSISGSLIAIKDNKLLFDAALFGRLEVDQRFVSTLETEKTYTVYISVSYTQMTMPTKRIV